MYFRRPNHTRTRFGLRSSFLGPDVKSNDVHASHLRCDSDLALFNHHFHPWRCAITGSPGPGSAVTYLPKTLRWSEYMRSSSDAPNSEPRCGFLPYLLQVSVTQHSSVSFVQLSFGQVTSRPHVHAAPEGPQPSFWGYVGHRHPSRRTFPLYLSYPSFPCAAVR